MFKHAQLETVRAFLGNPAHAELPLHARIQRAIRQLILDGALTAGRQLPATRALAASLAVSRDTVESAYAQLHSEEFITRRSGCGSFVAEKTEFQPSLGLRRSGRPPKATHAQLSRRGEAIVNSGGVCEEMVPRTFAPGVPETRGFPIALWERLQRQALKEAGTAALRHGSPQGLEALRRAIADYLNLERGAHATADRVLILTSAQQALTLCNSVLLDDGDPIFVEDPLYQGARKAFVAANLECIPIPVDKEGMQIQKLCAQPDRAKAVYLTPSHQFPTGATLSLERRLAVIDWAEKNQAWIIEDDYDSEFHYAGRPTACVQGLDPYARTVYIGTFTKSLFPGLRLGYMVLPPQLVQPMIIARTLMDGHTAPIPQMIVARFIEGGHFGARIRSMRKIYAHRLDVLHEAVGRHLTAFAEPRLPQGGMQMPCLVENEAAEKMSIVKAARVGVDLVGLSHLYLERPNAAGWLMGFAAYTPDEIDCGVRKLADALKEK